jgi:hypothetical protein
VERRDLLSVPAISIQGKHTIARSSPSALDSAKHPPPCLLDAAPRS